MLTRKMKDSGIKWIGEIPEDWEIRKLKYTLEERNEKNNPIITDNILSLSVERESFLMQKRLVAEINPSRI